MSELQRLEKPYKRIMLVGGGNIGAGLARRLEKDYSVKLIERNQQRAAELAEKLQNTIVFFGDASDQELLAEEHIDQVDLFIAVTNDDEANIMSAMLAKRMGCEKGDGIDPASRLCGSGSGERDRYCNFTATSDHLCVA
ncbi:trk system potassium uptake protein TrkA [Escherichia fergusonii]|nr:trk system potassium uptake protein TrkA [Escherichia fergusonii]